MTTTLLFLCPHAAAKSVAAVALFTEAAERLGLDATATNAGTDPDTSTNPIVADRLKARGLAPGHEPRRVTAADINGADIIVNLGCDPTDAGFPSSAMSNVINWSMPDFSDDPDAAFDAIQRATDRLATTLARRSRPIVVVGVGQMGGVFTKAFLGAGHTVVPVTRSETMAEVAATTADPAIVLVTVGEDDLDPVLATIPERWKDRVGLIQNELLPRDWQRHGINDPTVAVVWFEKKRGIDTKVIIPSPVAGPNASMLVAALTGDQIEAREVSSAEIVDEMIVKNLYILTANIAGLETGGTVSQLWSDHRELATEVGDEVLAIQEHLVGRPIDREAAFTGMLAAFEGDPDHGTTGRSAPRRLARALSQARTAHIETPRLNAIAHAHGVSA